MIKKIYVILIALMLVSLSSCTSQDTFEHEESVFDGETRKFTLRVSTLGNVASTDTELQEKIKSLRIILVSDGFIESNTKVYFVDESGSNSGSILAKNFIYNYDHQTVTGNKKVYLVANEESVRNIKFRGEPTLSSGVSEGMTLEDFLNSFSADELPEDGTIGISGGSAADFENLLNSIYFTPEYEEVANEIYLPYTAVYDGIETGADPNVTISKTMYLVPVATKFTFNFYNYRKEKVELHEIRLSKVNSCTYLMANLDESEQTKILEGKSYYWIDWLDKVAKGINSAVDPDAYADKAGWIERYSLPMAEDEIESDLEIRIHTPGSGENWSMEKLVNKDKPSTLSIVHYYPESIRMGQKTVYNSDKNEYEEIDAQVYTISIELQEIRDGVIPSSPYDSGEMEIDTLNSLFRSTHVVVEVDIYESIVEIYCEIAPWNEKKTFLGYLQEDDD